MRHGVREHLTADLRKETRALVEVGLPNLWVSARATSRQGVTYQLVESDLRSTGIIYKPPGVAKYGSAANVQANYHVPEE